MNIQQLAAEKAREKYPDNEDYTEIQNSLLRTERKRYISGFIDCLNYLAGSEGDVDKFIDRNISTDYHIETTHPVLAKAIQEHTATHCAKVLAQQWISVEDRLPENGVTVFLVNDLGVCCDGVYSETMKDFIIRGEAFNRETSLGHYITHWQLPSPPITQKNNI